MKKTKIFSIIMLVIAIISLTVSVSASAAAVTEDSVGVVQNETAQATEDTVQDDNSVISSKAMAAALVVGIVGAAAAIGMGIAIAKSSEGMARQPEVASKINSAMMLGLVFIETVIIYALIIAILVIFVL